MAVDSNPCFILVCLFLTFCALPRLNCQVHQEFVYEVRLVGSHVSEGRVEIKVNGTWGTVCDKQWDEEDAKVVCRQLGYASSYVLPIGEAFYGRGEGPILMDNVRCTGRESDLASCPSDGFGHHTCTHAQDAGVMCLPYDVPLRLAGGNLSSEGRVEVKVNGQWGTVCSGNWDAKDAQVVCRQLGFHSALVYALSDAFFGGGSGPVSMEAVACTGHESALTVCPFAGFSHHAVCDHNQDAGVICNPNDLPIRLMGDGTHPWEGRVEINVNGQWGTVCDNDWDVEDAMVVCRQLGFNSTTVTAYGAAFYGPGQGAILMDHVTCTGNERHLAYCGSLGFGQHACTHAQDAGVNCQPLDTRMRLVGDSPWEGRVEVEINGRWGTICDSSWDTDDAEVVCRQMGFKSTYVMAVSGAQYGEGAGPIHMDKVACTGQEEHLHTCPRAATVGHTCTHAEDASVICQPADIPMRLVAPTTNISSGSEGLLEVQLNGKWGTVCADGYYWKDSNARVVCAQLGYDSSDALAVTYLNHGHRDAYLSGGHCVGTETHLAFCPYTVVGTAPCVQDAGVICKPDEEAMRLVSNGFPWEGRVEVQVTRVWGTVCDTAWDEHDAEVVCRQMGFNSSTVFAVTGGFYGQGTGPVVLDRVDCVRTEPNLVLCPNSGLSQSDCLHSHDAGVICQPADIPVKLVGRTPGHGRVEMQVNGQWGSICDTAWDVDDAKVVCSQLGYDPSVAAVLPASVLDHSLAPVLLDTVQCVGTESHVALCPSSAFGKSSTTCLSHSHDAGVMCVPFAVRLADGASEREGRVEVNINGMWGTVCDDYFDAKDAQVVCRQLGFSTDNAQFTGPAFFGQGAGHVFLTNARCAGSEMYLSQCPITGYESINCGHDEDVGVKCSPA